MLTQVESNICCPNANVLASFCAHNVCMSDVLYLFSGSLIRFYNQGTLKIKGAVRRKKKEIKVY